MPKLACPCGFVHDLSPIPDDGWVAVRDRDGERFRGLLRLLDEISPNKVPSLKEPRTAEWLAAMRDLVALQSRIYQCPECRRLMWWRRDTDTYQVYRLEQELPSDGGRERGA